MSEIKKNNSPRSYKEKFEFELTVDNNIICQRYFRINDFNPMSLKSYELSEAIRKCVTTIDNDLKMKTQAYLEIYAPLVFDSEKQMREFLSKPENYKNLTVGEGVVGKQTSELQKLYFDVVKGKVEKYKKWCTPIYD